MDELDVCQGGNRSGGPVLHREAVADTAEHKIPGLTAEDRAVVAGAAVEEVGAPAPSSVSFPPRPRSVSTFEVPIRLSSPSVPPPTGGAVMIANSAVSSASLVGATSRLPPFASAIACRAAVSVPFGPVKMVKICTSAVEVVEANRDIGQRIEGQVGQVFGIQCRAG